MDDHSSLLPLTPITNKPWQPALLDNHFRVKYSLAPFPLGLPMDPQRTCGLSQSSGCSRLGCQDHGAWEQECGSHSQAILNHPTLRASLFPF